MRFSHLLPVVAAVGVVQATGPVMLGLGRPLDTGVAKTKIAVDAANVTVYANATAVISGFASIGPHASTQNAVFTAANTSFANINATLVALAATLNTTLESVASAISLTDVAALNATVVELASLSLQIRAAFEKVYHFRHTPSNSTLASKSDTVAFYKEIKSLLDGIHVSFVAQTGSRTVSVTDGGNGTSVGVAIIGGLNLYKSAVTHL